jgi:hypothetical protein
LTPIVFPPPPIPNPNWFPFCCWTVLPNPNALSPPPPSSLLPFIHSIHPLIIVGDHLDMEGGGGGRREEEQNIREKIMIGMKMKGGEGRRENNRGKGIGRIFLGF